MKDGKNIHASSLGGYDWVVPKDAQDPDGAFAFIEFMAQPKIVSDGWNTGRLPPRTDIVIDNPQWPQAYAIYHEQLESARARGPHPQWPDLSRPMQTAIQEAITGKRSRGRGADGRGEEDPADTCEDAVVNRQRRSGRNRPPAPPARAGARISQSLLYVFLAIPILYLLALVAFPVAYNVIMSLQEVTLGNIAALGRPWVGLDNYREVLGDPDFRKVLFNSLLFVAANVIAQLGIGLAVALFFSQRFPGVHFLRGLLLAAWMLPALVVGALWKWLFATQYGVINFVRWLGAVRCIGWPIRRCR